MPDEAPATDPKPIVLIVDDIQSNILVVASVLTSDCEVLFANNGPEALEIVASTIPDLVILDVMMPGMDGYETCRRMQADGRMDGVPILFLSALGDEAAETRGLDAGAVDYLTKPVRPHRVRARVRNLLKLRQALLRERTLTLKLTEALARVSELQGLLPICAWCKQVRDDQGYWLQLDTYLSRYIPVQLTHGMCPDCAKHFEEETVESDEAQFATGAVEGRVDRGEPLP